MTQSHGQCRIVQMSTTKIYLNPYNGNGLVINGFMQTVPQPYSLLLTNSGLNPNTTYYIYAWMNGGTMALRALQASTNGHETSATAGNVGIEILFGNDSFTLVGMTQTDASGLFIPTNGLSCGTISWFNRRTAYCSTGGGSFSTSVPTFENFLGTGLPCLKWLDASVIIGAYGYGQPEVAQHRIAIYPSDSLAFNSFASTVSNAAADSAAVAGQFGNLNTSTSCLNTGEGFHQFTVWGASQDGGLCDFVVTPWVWLEY